MYPKAIHAEVRASIEAWGQLQDRLRRLARLNKERLTATTRRKSTLLQQALARLDDCSNRERLASGLLIARLGLCGWPSPLPHSPRRGRKVRREEAGSDHGFSTTSGILRAGTQDYRRSANFIKVRPRAFRPLPPR